MNRLRPQFTLKTLLWLMAAVAAFCAGVGFERERQRRADERAAALGPIRSFTTTERKVDKKTGEVTYSVKTEWMPPSQAQRSGHD